MLWIVVYQRENGLVQYVVDDRIVERFFFPSENFVFLVGGGTNIWGFVLMSHVYCIWYEYDSTRKSKYLMEWYWIPWHHVSRQWKKWVPVTIKEYRTMCHGTTSTGNSIELFSLTLFHQHWLEPTQNVGKLPFRCPKGLSSLIHNSFE